MDITQLLSPTEAARLKGMSLNRFKYQADKPAAIIVGNGHQFYDREQIMLWKPARTVTKKRKTTRKDTKAV